MSLHSQFATNEALEVDGTWFPYPQPDGSIVELKLARSGGENTAYKRELRRLLRKHKKARDIPIEQYKPAEDEICQAIADHILKDWRTTQLDGKVEKKIEGGDGKMIGYSVARAKRLMQQLPELRNDVTMKSSDFTNFQEVEPEDVEKN